ncbi:MAG: purine-cytosine permease family protein [Thermoguttaceae bacterium]
MSGCQTKPGIFERLDKLYEFDRQPVSQQRLQPGRYFAAVFAGEHVAATEFVIGASLVRFGATASDVLVGLLIGNLLAVLSWTLVCAPIAVQTRLTLYWYLRKIAGPAVALVYNVLNAILFCILAGAMITVSASAVRIPFGVRPETEWLPRHYAFVLVVLGVGAVVVTLAILGFRRLAQFAAVCWPWMVVIFPAGALMVLPGLGQISGWSDLGEVARTAIWKGPTPETARPLGFWHVAAFAWICNLATHLGLSDMALLRYARRASYGLYSAFGMYLGHYVAWVCAGVMGAAAAAAMKLPLAQIDSGQVAYAALGSVGVLAVILAGWTTANPTLYRAGLALQVVTPGWPRWLVTLIAGGLTTLVACFPFVFRGLLDFVALYGIVLVPVGAIVVAEHWLFPAVGLTRFWNARQGRLVNWPALLSWLAALAVAAAAWVSSKGFRHEIIHEFFLAIPVWVVTTASYLGLAALGGARQGLPGPAEQPRLMPAPPATDGPAARVARLSAVEKGLAGAAGLAALGSLAWWIGAALYNQMTLEIRQYEDLDIVPDALGWQHLVFFASAAVWLHLWEKSRPWKRTLYMASGLVAAACLALCLFFPFCVYMSWVMPSHVRSHLVSLTAAYFVAALVWLRQREKKPLPAAV